MKKLVTISTTAMMGFTALGGFQGIAQAMENSSVGVVSTFAQHVLGDTVHADEPAKKLNTTLVWNYVANNTKRTVSLFFNGDKISANFVEGGGYGEYFFKLDVTVFAPDGTQRWEKEVINTDEELGSFNEGDVVHLKSYWYKPGVVNFVENKGDAIQGLDLKNFDLSNRKEYLFTKKNGQLVLNPDQQTQTDVTFDHTATPGEPGWYGVVPKAITFTDDNKDKALDATVKIVNANDQKTDYTGAKSVAVKVKSTNGFELKDGKKAAVEYSLTTKDNKPVTKNQNEQDLGIVKKGDVAISSKATLKGQAQESGKFVDTLNYHFIEQ